MKYNHLFYGAGAGVGIILSASIALAWTNPPPTPPTGNTAPPLNAGNTSQIKSAGIGVNSLAVFGNTLMSGAGRYINFGNAIPGSTISAAGFNGYGFRDNSGNMEYKNAGDAGWSPIGHPAGSASSFGQRSTGDINGKYSFGTNYRADTDGFVVAYTQGPVAPNITAYADSFTPPSTERATGGGYGSGSQAGLMMPVRAGEYWRVTRSSAMGAGHIEWMPLSN